MTPALNSHNLLQSTITDLSSSPSANSSSTPLILDDFEMTSFENPSKRHKAPSFKFFIPKTPRNSPLPMYNTFNGLDDFLDETPDSPRSLSNFQERSLSNSYTVTVDALAQDFFSASFQSVGGNNPLVSADLNDNTNKKTSLKRSLDFEKDQSSSIFIQRTMHILENNEIQKDGAAFALISLENLNDNHFEVYALKDHEVYFIDGVDNRNILIKILKKEIVSQGEEYIQRVVLGNILRQYDQLQLMDAKLPTVKIYNRGTVQTDGYLAIEKTKPFVIPWDDMTTRMTLNTLHKHVLDMLSYFVGYVFTRSLNFPCNLRPDNFGMRGEQLVLLNISELATELPDTFESTKENYLEALSNGNKFVYNHLKTFDPTNNLT